MNASDLDPTDARAVVESRLGRPPQDMLEAAVVLEAWGGLPAATALTVGARLTHSTRGARHASRAVLAASAPRDGGALETLAFVATIIAIACWAHPLADALGGAAVKTTLRIALPLSIAFQWALNSRYLSRSDGPAQIGRRPLAVALVAGTLIILFTLVVGEPGLIAALLMVTWVAGTILIAERHSIGYLTLILLATAGLTLGWTVIGTLACVATTAIVAVVLSTTNSLQRTPPSHEPGRWSRAMLAAWIGLAVGGLLIGDPTVDWALGVVPAVGLLPSTLAGAWAGTYLWRLHEVVPRSLVGVPINESGRATRAPLGMLAGAIARLCGLAAVLSVGLVVGAHVLGVHISNPMVLAGFGLIALATLLVSLLEAIGHGFWALIALAIGVCVEWALSHTAHPVLAGRPLIVGAVAVIVVCLPAATVSLNHPARTLATRLRVT